MSEKSACRVGIFGGTFDPIHVGHLAVASAAAHGAELARVLFVVAHHPWQKLGTRKIAPSRLRFAMVRAAVEHDRRFDACDVEIERGGDSYTIDTVEQLQSRHADVEFVLVVGSDSVGGLQTWHRHRELAELASLVIIDRPGTEGDRPESGWTYQRVQAPLVDLSSSLLRARMEDDLPVDYLVPRAALHLYRQHVQPGQR